MNARTVARSCRLPDRLRPLLALLVLFAGTCAAATLDAPQYHHTAWSVEQGAPADIWALAQGRDGYLWLGTGTGLYRFDGLEFEHYAPPPPQRFATSNVTALYMADDDTLWIGFLLGGISAMRDGSFIHYRAGDGAPTGMVLGFATGRDRTLWAASIGGLMRFDGHRWHRVGKEWAYPGERADAMLLDSRGTLWVSTGETVLYLPRGERRFRPTGERVSNFPSFAEAPDGTLWLSDRLHGTRPLPQADAARAVPPSPPSGFAHFAQMRFDRMGVLWGTDRIGGGVVRVSSPQRVRGGRGLRAEDADAVIGKRDGLSSDRAVPVFEDREGNVWIGTNMGLHRFRYNNVRALRDGRLHQQLSYGIAVGREHEVLASSGGRIYGVRGGLLEPVADTGEHSIAGMVAGRDGSVWLSAPHRIVRLQGAELAEVPLPAGAGAPISLLVDDGGDGVLAMYEGRGLYQHDGTQWREIAAGELKALNATTLLRRSDGSIWVGYLDNALTRWDGRAKQHYSARDGLDVGTITALADSDLGLLVAGESGLALFHDGRFQRLLAAQPQLLHGITGIVVTDRGELWLNGIRGVMRVEREALRRSMSDPRRELALRVFNLDDGLPGVAQQAPVSPSATLGRDGRVWFATNQGLAVIDPARLRSNTIAPPVTVRALFAEGRRHPAISGLRLPKGTTDLRIDYAALSLSVPERVQLRYRLGGVDRHWQDAGNRRQAFYTNLGPGDYRFHVIAANDSGVWNEQGATLEFRIEPRFTQTWWFAALCVMATAGVLFSLYLLRLRQIAERVHLRLEERHQERERIARELHDTLLQGIQGLILRFQAIANRLPMDDPTRTAMEQALDRADEAIAEGRDRVSDLRASMASPDLAAAFARIGEELAEGHPVDFRVMVEGRLPMVDPVVREEIYWIGREVLVNAFRHAEASRIEVEISASMETLSFRFRDNGKGMQSDVQQAAAKPRHWGLRGIRERAQGISAELGIWSKEGSGTEVELVIPMNAAYIRSRRQGWRERLTRAWRR